MKLDRLVAKYQWMGRSKAHRWIAQGKVSVDGIVVQNPSQDIDRFSRVCLTGWPESPDTEVEIRHGEERIYIALHKPIGVLSATVDREHQTVIDLVDVDEKEQLHLAGRLDRMTSGLVLLTNDGAWSKRITLCHQKIPKSYYVGTENEIDETMVERFQSGFYFEPEGVWTLPARLDRLEPKLARVILTEGRHHQIKRMIRMAGNRVVSLHRYKIGSLELSDCLEPGSWMRISPEDVFRTCDFDLIDRSASESSLS